MRIKFVTTLTLSAFAACLYLLGLAENSLKSEKILGLSDICKQMVDNATKNFALANSMKKVSPAVLNITEKVSPVVLNITEESSDVVQKPPFIENIKFPSGPSSDTEAIIFHLVSMLTNRRKPSEYRREEKSFAMLWNAKNLRSLESIFYFHPNAIVKIHSNALETDDFKAFIDGGFNVSVVPIDLDEISRSTSLEGIRTQKRYFKWEVGHFWYSHVSDMLRLLVLYRYGGVYLDTDVVVTRSFHDIDNALGYQDEEDINGAVMVFKKPGNEYLKWCIDEFNQRYDRTRWDANGPKLLSRVYQRFAMRAWSARAVRVMPSSTFQPIPWENVRSHCFQNATGEEDMFLTAVKFTLFRPYAVHWNNHHNSQTKILPGTLCEYLFTRFCVLCRGEPAPPARYPTFALNGVELSLP